MDTNNIKSQRETKLSQDNLLSAKSKMKKKSSSPLINHRSNKTDQEIFRKNKVENKVFIGGIKNRISESDIRKFFSAFGKVKSVKIFFNPSTKIRRGFGFIIFEEKEAFEKVTAVCHFSLKNCLVQCKEARPFESEKSQKSTKTSSTIASSALYKIDVPSLNKLREAYLNYVSSGSLSFVKEYSATIKTFKCLYY